MNIIDKKRAEIARLEAEIVAIQTKCNHPAVSEEKWGVGGDAHMATSAHGGSTLTCELCGHKWTTQWSDNA